MSGAPVSEPADPSADGSEESASPAKNKYHPEFSPDSLPDFDVTLFSCDRVGFRVGANVLRSGSRFFEETLSLPQPVTTSGDRVIDNISEDADTLRGLLQMITGKGIPALETLDAMEPLLMAAEKYEMRVPSDIMRLLILTTPNFLEDHMRLYHIGCRLGWDDVAKLASKHSCYDDLFQPSLKPTFQTMDPCDLLRLLAFHKKRRDRMDELLQTGDLAAFQCIEPSGCPLGSTREFENFRWRVLSLLDHTPPASAVSAGTIKALYNAASLGDIRHEHSVNTSPARRWVPSEVRVMEALNQYWESLPKTVD